MANYSRWDDIKKKRDAPSAETRAGVEQDLALGQLIYDLRTEAGLGLHGLASGWAPPIGHLTSKRGGARDPIARPRRRTARSTRLAPTLSGTHVNDLAAIACGHPLGALGKARGQVQGRGVTTVVCVNLC